MIIGLRLWASFCDFNVTTITEEIHFHISIDVHLDLKPSQTLHSLSQQNKKET